jgi:hypothetical protein
MTRFELTFFLDTVLNNDANYSINESNGLSVTIDNFELSRLLGFISILGEKGTKFRIIGSREIVNNVPESVDEVEIQFL